MRTFLAVWVALSFLCFIYGSSSHSQGQSAQQLRASSTKRIPDFHRAFTVFPASKELAPRAGFDHDLAPGPPQSGLGQHLLF